MPLYFFDVHEGEIHCLDDHGHEFADIHEAREQALLALPHIAKDQLPDGNRRDLILEMRDDAHTIIFTATLSIVARWGQKRGC